MRLRRSLALLLVVAIVVPVLAFAAIAVYRYGREQSAATEPALLDATRALVVALDDPRTRDIPVVILSADASQGQTERLLKAGARAYLTEPLDVTKLLAVLDEAAPLGAR
jgi:CheY-like chemotaxis protein